MKNKKSLEEVLDSISLEDLSFSKRLKDIEKDDLASLPDLKRHLIHMSLYLNKANSLPFMNQDISSSILNWFLGRAIFCGRDAISCHKGIDEADGIYLGILLGKVGGCFVNLGKNNPSVRVKERCIKRGALYLEEAVQNIPNIPSDLKNSAYGHVGRLFFDAQREVSDFNTELKYLLFSIRCSELSGIFGNQDKKNYEQIGRAYYDLQFLIGKSFREKGARGLQEVKGRIVDVLNQFEGIFEKKRISLLKFTSCSYEELQLSALENAFKAFNLAKRQGDKSRDNMSYRGSCLTKIVGLKDRFGRIDKKTARRDLEKARELLTVVYQKRGDVKDCSRLAECQFRFAKLAKDVDVKKTAYREAIDYYEKAEEALVGTCGRVNSEIFSYRAGCFFKLAEITEGEEKERNLEKAAEDFNKAFREGDETLENRSKKSVCFIELLKCKLRKGWDERVESLIKETKNNLEKSIEINKDNNRISVYPYFLFYDLSSLVMLSGRRLDMFSLRDSRDYIDEALENYERGGWEHKEIGGSLHLMCEPLDEHGLLRSRFLMKKGRAKYLEREVDNAGLLSERLKREFGTNSKFCTINPLSIVSHQGDKYYVMDRVRGATLGEMVQNGCVSFELIRDVAKFLGFIHARMPFGGSSFEYESYVRDKLRKLAVEEGIVRKIVDNYASIKADLESGFFVFNKDARSRNWIIEENGEHRIFAIDLESKYTGVPAEVDVSSLLEYLNLDFNDKKRLFETYRESFEEFLRGSFDEDRFPCYRRYLNASLPRAVSILSWPTTQRSERRLILKNVRGNLLAVKQEDPAYHRKFSHNYQGLLDGLRRLIKVCNK